MKNQQVDEASDVELECVNCGSKNIETEEVEDTFEYGGREKLFTVTARFPVQTCRDCGLSFMDGYAEQLRHDAACRQLGVMTPDEVRAVRETHGMTQAEFAQLSKLGEASLSRWERGVLIQNEGHDQLLYLLRFPDNVERLRQRKTADVPASPNGFAEGMSGRHSKTRARPKEETTSMTIPKDRFGSRIGTNREKLHNCISHQFKALRQLVQEAGIDYNTFSDHLDDLVKRGLLESMGQGTDKTYRLPAGAPCSAACAEKCKGGASRK